MTRDQIEAYGRDGFLSPVTIVSEQEASRIRGKIEALEKQLGGSISGTDRSKLYLRYRWIYELATTTAMLDVAEDLLGPDILLYYGNCWFKNNRDEGF